MTILNGKVSIVNELVSYLIEHIVQKKVGGIDIDINDLSVDIDDDGIIHIHGNVDAMMTQNELWKIVKNSCK